MDNTVLTIAQQQRREALINAAGLLVDRSIAPSSMFTKGADATTTAGAMSAVDAPEAITLAEYIISGVDTPPRQIKITEDGFITTYEDA